LLALAQLAAAPAVAVEAGDVQEGEASYYANALHGNKTASGAPYDKNAMTAAHHTLPFGTVVKVTYLKTGESVEVTINDRIPRKTKRLIDVSRAAAEKLGMIKDGVGPATVEVVSTP
jgi:rare lipoprotein A